MNRAKLATASNACSASKLISSSQRGRCVGSVWLAQKAEAPAPDQNARLISERSPRGGRSDLGWRKGTKSILEHDEIDR
jgi:hypothetical protein